MYGVENFASDVETHVEPYDPQFLFVPLYKKHEVIQVALSSPHILMHGQAVYLQTIYGNYLCTNYRSHWC